MSEAANYMQRIDLTGQLAEALDTASAPALREQVKLLLAELAALRASHEELRKAMELAQPVIEEELQTLCFSYCPPCEEGQVFDYSELKEPELSQITRTEAALGAIAAALQAWPGEIAAADKLESETRR
jgi:hypothetical protein